MLAWMVSELGEPKDVLVLGEVPDPTPRPGQVLIEVEAVALNFPDALLCRGAYQHKPRLPFVPGGEVSGRVVEVGSPGAFAPGDAVVALTPGGGFGGRVLANEVAVFPLKRLGLTWAEAAALPASFQTAYAAVHLRGEVEPGETVLIHAGAGGLGSAAIQIAVAAGARVIATAGGAEKVEICRQLGADVAIDHRATPDLVATVKELTDGRGVEVVVDPVGGSIAEASLRCLRFGGRLVLVGFASGRFPDLSANSILLKNVSVVGLHWGLYSARQPETVAEVHERIVELVSERRARPVVSQEGTWQKLPSLLQSLADGETWGKVVVRPEGGTPA